MAAVSQVNLVIPKGVNFEETFFLATEDGGGLNLTGQTVVAKLKKHPNAMKVLENVFFIGCSPTITDEMISYIEEVVDSYKKL